MQTPPTGTDRSRGHPVDRRTVLQGACAGLVAGSIPGVASATDDPTLYIGGAEGGLYAFDATDGSERWSQSVVGFLSSATVADGILYIGTETGRLHAYEAETGNQLWSAHQNNQTLYSSPTVIDELVFVGSDSGDLFAYDYRSGELEWSSSSPTGPIRTSPQVVDGTVFYGSNDTNVYARSYDNDIEWEFTVPDGTVHSSPTVVDGIVYVGSNDETLYAINAFTGDLLWDFTHPESPVQTSPTVVDGIVYIGTWGGTLYALDADSGSLVWEFDDPSDRVYSSPTVSGGDVYVGSDDQTVYALDAATGDRVWQYAGGGFGDAIGKVLSSPTVYDQTVYVADLDGAIHALDVFSGSEVWSSETGDRFRGSPTVVATQSGDSTGTRTEHGTLGHGDSWAATTTTTGPAAFEVSIPDTPAPVEAGAEATVSVQVENIGGQSDTQSITLEVQELGATETTVSLSGQESAEPTLSVEIPEDAEGEYDATVTSADDTASTVVTVLAAAQEPYFDLEITDFSESVEAGTDISATVLVTNTGTDSGSATVEFDIDGLPETTDATVSLGPEESTEETLTLPAPTDVSGEFTATLQTADVAVSETLEVIDTTDDGNGDEETGADETTDDEETDAETDGGLGGFGDGDETEDAPTDEPTSTDDDGPGLGVLSALSGLGGTAYLVSRRLARDEE